jgi:hypothetical protein
MPDLSGVGCRTLDFWMPEASRVLDAAAVMWDGVVRVRGLGGSGEQAKGEGGSERARGVDRGSVFAGFCVSLLTTGARYDESL